MKLFVAFKLMMIVSLMYCQFTMNMKNMIEAFKFMMIMINGLMVSSDDEF